MIDRQTPLTTDQATELFGQAGDPDYFDSLESLTCSLHCWHCDERVWFPGSHSDQRAIYKCPYCNKMNWNQYALVSIEFKLQRLTHL